jgi:ATP-dependent Clp protease ATP-binding subunit ClpB
MEELRGFFRPEFLNRIDDIVVFKALSKDDLRGIVDIQLRRLERLLSDKRAQGAAHRQAAKAPPRRSRLRAQRSAPARSSAPSCKELQNPLAEAILQGGFVAGKVVAVDVKDDKFVFS